MYKVEFGGEVTRVNLKILLQIHTSQGNYDTLMSKQVFDIILYHTCYEIDVSWLPVYIDVCIDT